MIAEDLILRIRAAVDPTLVKAKKEVDAVKTSQKQAEKAAKQADREAKARQREAERAAKAEQRAAAATANAAEKARQAEERGTAKAQAAAARAQKQADREQARLVERKARVEEQARKKQAADEAKARRAAEVAETKARKKRETEERKAEEMRKKRMESAQDAFVTFAAVTGAALAALTVSSVRAVRDQQRLADGLGETLQTVQELDYTFRALGADENDLADALSTIADRAEDAKGGMQSFIDDFKLIGIAVDDLRGKSPAELFDLLIEKSGQTTDANKRVTASVRLFGDDLGRRLIPLMAEGSTGLARFRAQARDLGVVMTDDVGKAALDAAYGLDRLQTRVGAIVRSLGLRLIPTTQAFTREGNRLLDIAQPLISGFFDGLSGAVNRTAAAMETPAGRIIALLVGGASTVGLAGALARLAPQIPVVGAALAPLGSALAALAGPALIAAGVALAIDDLNAAADGTPSIIGRFAEALGVRSEVESSLARIKRLLIEASSAFGMLGRSMAEAAAQGQANWLKNWDRFVTSLADDRLEAAINAVTAALSKMWGAAMPDIGGNIDSAIRGFELAGRYAAGDAGVEISSGPGAGVSTPLQIAAGTGSPLAIAGVVGFSAANAIAAGITSSAQRQRDNVAVSVNVQSGPTNEQIAQAAGRATTQQVRTALAQAGG